MSLFSTLAADSLEFLPFVLVFAAIVLSVLGIGLLFAGPDAVQRRLQSAASRAEGEPVVGLRRKSESTFYRTIVQPLERHLVPAEIRQLSSLRLRLVQAGFFAPSAPSAYYAIRILLGIAFPAVIGFFVPALAGSISVNSIILLMAVLGTLGYILPMWVVSHRVSARQQQAREGFPDALDMLMMCVEAGLGLDAAINRIGGEIQAAQPLLAEHFDLLAAELRAGRTREDAFRAFSDRIGIDEVKSLTGLLLQTEALGTSMADALRSLSDDMRQRRLLRAEELAQKISTKLSLVLTTFILPVLLTVVTAPAFLNAVRNFRHIGGVK